jgi:conjugation system TraG family ATPase
MEKALNDLLPILEISQDCIVSKTGDYTACFELTKPEIFTLSASDLATLHETWVKAIRVLSPSTILHWQDWYTEEVYTADVEKEDNSFLSQASERFFHERSYLDHRCYLYITRVPAGRKPASHGLSSLLGPSLVPRELLQPSAIREFLVQVGQFERVVTDGGFIRLKRLGKSDLTGDEETAGIIEQYCQMTAWGRHSGNPEIRDIAFEDDGMRIGDCPIVLYSLADAENLPTQCSSSTPHAPYSTDRTPFPLGFATALGPLLYCNHIYNQYISISETGAILQKLDRKQRRMQSLSGQSRANALGKEAVQSFINESLSGQKTLVKAHFNILAWADTPAGITDLKSRTPSALAHMGATPHLETTGAPLIWWAGIPGNAGEMPASEYWDTFAEQAACFLIPETNYRSSVSPFGLRLGDRITGKPVHTDLSDEPMRTGTITNRNKFILGGSGSGKSFFTNHLVRSYYEQGAHIVLVDVGGSYKGLCELVKGYYFSYSQEAPLRFNPWNRLAGDSADPEKRESIKALLLTLWKKGDESFLRSEYVALSNALQGYDEFLSMHTDIFPCFDSFYEYLQQDFTKALAEDRVRDKYFDIDNFLYVLRPFYRGGEYDYLLNARERLDLIDQRFLIFELDNIKDHPILFPVVTIIIMEVFITKMRKLQGVRKMILIEEAWKAIAKEGMGEYIKYLFKTVRKFYGEAIVVTQELDDIISSPIVKESIINVSDCKILLDLNQFQNKFDQIEKLVGLTEKDKALVLSLNKANDPNRKYKEVFIKLGSRHSKVYRTEVSLEEYLTYTTEESEKMKVQAYAARFGSMREGIIRLAEQIRQSSK